MFGLGTMELVIIGTLTFLIFGSRLPRAMYNIGRSFVELRKGFEETDDTREIRQEDR